MIISQDSLLHKQIQTICKRTTGTFHVSWLPSRWPTWWRAWSRSWTASQIRGTLQLIRSFFSSSNSASIMITKIAMLCPLGVSDKLLWHPPSSKSFSTHNCKKKSDTISVLQVSYTFDEIILTLLMSLSLSLSSSFLARKKLALDSSHTLKNLHFESLTFYSSL